MPCINGKSHVCCTRIENLSVHTGGEYIIKDVNLHLHCGELTAIVGRNGAGKTTFIKALLGLVPHSGSIVFEGEKCIGGCAREHTKGHDRFCSCRKSVLYRTEKPVFGYVPQSLSLDEGSPVSVSDIVLSCVSKRPVFLPRLKKEINLASSILSKTGCENLLSRRVCDLSGGEMQKVMLALALSPVPDILLLDEPLSGVDRAGTKDFYTLVSSIRREYDITILLVSHDLDLVSRYADRVVFIYDSSAIVGSVKDVYRHKDFIEVFGCIPIEKGDEEKESFFERDEIYKNQEEKV